MGIANGDQCHEEGCFHRSAKEYHLALMWLVSCSCNHNSQIVEHAVV